MGEQRFGIRDIQIRGFRSARSVEFRPGPVCAPRRRPKRRQVECARSDLDVAPAGSADAGRHGPKLARSHGIELRAQLSGGEELALEAGASDRLRASGAEVPVLFLPAALRAHPLLASPVVSEAARAAGDYFQREKPESA